MRHRPRGILITGGVLALVAMGVSACGSSSTKSSGAPGPSGSSAASAAAAPVKVQGIDGTVVKIAGIGASPSFSQGFDDGVKARLKRANDTHELGKYTIDYLGTKDDQGSPAKSLPVIQQLVQREKVFAVGPIADSGFQAPAGKYLESKKIPYFGPGFSAAWCSPYNYGISWEGCAVNGKSLAASNIIPFAKAVGKPISDLKWAVVGLAYVDGAATNAKFGNTITKLGGKVVYNKAIVPVGGTGDLQPIISSVLAAKPDVIVVVMGAETIAFKAGLKAAGFPSNHVVDYALYSPGILKTVPAIADALEGSYTITPQAIEDDTPYVTQLKADYAAVGNPGITYAGLNAYNSLDVFIAAMKKVAPNFDKLISTLQSGFDYTPAKGGEPLSWPEAYDNPYKCSTLVQTVNKEFKVAEPFACDQLVS